jgi:hypothetical protein
MYSGASDIEQRGSITTPAYEKSNCVGDDLSRRDKNRRLGRPVDSLLFQVCDNADNRRLPSAA